LSDFKLNDNIFEIIFLNILKATLIIR